MSSSSQLDWYYCSAADVISSGPVTAAAIRQLLDTGSIGWDHSVRHRDWDRWYSLREAASQLELALPPVALVRVDPTAGLPRPTDPVVPSPPTFNLPTLFNLPTSSMSSLESASHWWDDGPDRQPSPTDVTIEWSGRPRSDPIRSPRASEPGPALPPPRHDAVLPPPDDRNEPAIADRTEVVGDAPFVLRLVSWAIDVSVLILATVICGALVPPVVAMAATFIAATAYVVALPLRGFDTIGHSLVGLRVVRREDDGSPDWVVHATRTAVILVLAAPCLVGIIASICSMHAHPRSWAWHDVATGTSVVRVRPFRFERHPPLTAAVEHSTA